MKAQFWSDQLLDAMLRADRSGAANLVERVLADGHDPDQVITELLDPALVRLGDLWKQADASLAHTFVAAKIAEDALLRCLSAPGQAAPRPNKGCVVIGNIEDDYHSLGRRMVASFLKAAGWEVYDLGNDTVSELFVEKALEVDAAIIGASAMTHTTAMNIRKLRNLIDSRGLSDRIKLAVGGAVFNWRPDLVAEVGGDGTASNASGSNALCVRLLAETRNPSGKNLQESGSSAEGGRA